MAGGFVRLAGVFLAFDSPALPALRLHLRVCVTLLMQGRCGGCILIAVPRMEYIRSSNSTPQERGVVVDKGGQVDHQVHHITCETMSVQPRADPIRDVGSDELRAQQMRARRGLVLLASDVGSPWRVPDDHGGRYRGPTNFSKVQEQKCRAYSEKRQVDSRRGLPCRSWVFVCRQAASCKR
ncbi:uncharacterized protein CLUP02_11121 [Colletotrichum lupini]|uniref:Uncharacterized protein n=1 Tax=Colletotrichum lupini TaxID=145971 RepID=A0A9Q8SZT1_9PEZI|nr:uncharacterized protein CLUP02_11121 [Colletotrichum lupini]UQC85622.1 hypothetical protein CLUP02_11121 [Colletotrichum lupini]